jgi:hypothetical protein
VTASSKLKLTPAMSRSLLYTKGGVLPAKSPEEPMFAVAESVGGAVTTDRKAFAAGRLRQTALKKDITIESAEAITVAGLEGWEMIARAKHAKTGAGMFIYQVILFDEGSYVLLQGMGGTALRDEFLPEFQDMARSFKRKPAANR